MKPAPIELDRPTPERTRTIIIMDGTRAIYIGFTDKEKANKIIEMIETANRRIPTQ